MGKTITLSAVDSLPVVTFRNTTQADGNLHAMVCASLSLARYQVNRLESMEHITDVQLLDAVVLDEDAVFCSVCHKLMTWTDTGCQGCSRAKVGDKVLAWFEDGQARPGVVVSVATGSDKSAEWQRATVSMDDDEYCDWVGPVRLLTVRAKS